MTGCSPRGSGPVLTGISAVELEAGLDDSVGIRSCAEVLSASGNSAVVAKMINTGRMTPYLCGKRTGAEVKFGWFGETD